jgi:SAM-dependent methyltransferase
MMLPALHVGCGPATLPDGVFPPSQWAETRLDIDADVQPDVVASIVAMPLADRSYAAVYSSHNLEHLAPDDVPRALAEFYRVLMPNGFALIAVPDMGLAAGRIAEGRGEDTVYEAPCGPITALDMVFGHAGMRRDNPWMAHRTGFTAATLRSAMEAAGFRVADLDVSNYALTVVGVRDGDGA